MGGGKMYDSEGQARGNYRTALANFLVRQGVPKKEDMIEVITRFNDCLEFGEKNYTKREVFMCPVPKKRVSSGTGGGDFERIRKEDIDCWLEGKIIDVKYDPKHEFDVWKKDSSGKGILTEQKELKDGVQIVIDVVGYEKPKYSKWYKFSYFDQANLVKVFLSNIVDNFDQNVLESNEWDINNIIGTKIKIMFEEKEDGGYQNIFKVKTVEDKIKVVPIETGKTVAKDNQDKCKNDVSPLEDVNTSVQKSVTNEEDVPF